MLNVPSDNFLINAHKNEMMLPAYIASPMRSFFEDGIQPNTQAFGGGASSAASGGDTIIHFNPVIQAIDGASVQAFFNKHGATVARTLSKQMTRNITSRPDY
jgi:hypothetical protein